MHSGCAERKAMTRLLLFVAVFCFVTGVSVFCGADEQTQQCGAVATSVQKENETKAEAPLISEEKAIAIAKEYAAEEKGENAEQHKEIDARYDEVEKTWDVSFKMDPMPPGGFFDVIIDGQTGEVIDFQLGE